MSMIASEKDKKQHRIFNTADSLPGKDAAEFYIISNYLSKGAFFFSFTLFIFYFGIFLPFLKKKGNILFAYLIQI